MISISFGVLFLLAFVMSVEFGQTAAEIIRQGTGHSFKNAVLVSFGAFVAEVLFLALTLTGFIFLFSDPGLLKFVWATGGIIIFHLGIQGLRNYKNVITLSNGPEGNNHRWPFVTGLTINFAHPLNIVWWSGTLGPIVLESAHNNGFFSATLDGLGVPFGGLAWWIILSSTSALMKKSIPGSLIKNINLLSSLGLILFGVYFLYRAFRLFFL